MPYTPTTWNPGVAPGISAAELNRIEQGIVDAHAGAIYGNGLIRAGGAQNSAQFALTTTLTDAASVVFTKPAEWDQYYIMAWGIVFGVGPGTTDLLARVEIGASNGPTATVGNIASMTVPVFHAIDPTSASPVTIAIAVAEAAGNTVHESSTIQYLTFRLSPL